MVDTLSHPSDRQLAAQALELQTNERFRQLADNLHIVLALANGDFSELLFVNRAYETIWGRTLESFYAEPWSFLEGIHENDRGQVQDLIRRLIGGEPIDDLECRVVRPDGSTSWVLCRCFPIRDVQGHVCRLVGSAQDITQRKRTDQQVQSRLESVLESVADVHILFDLNWRYLYANQAAVRAIGRPRDQILGRTLWQVYPDIIGTELDRQYRRSIYERLPVTFDFYYPTTDTWWENRFYPAPEGLAVFATDITERKRAEEELRRLSGQLLRLQDEERRKIARDLHDATGQDLVALATDLGQLHASVHLSTGESRKLISKCRALADRCIREVRTLSYLLHPPMLDESGLEDAVRHYADGFAERAGIQVKFEISRRLGRMRRDIELALFRVVQESLINIQRHSGSVVAKIRLDRKPGAVSLDGSLLGMPRTPRCLSDGPAGW